MSGLGHTFGCHRCTVVVEIINRGEIPQKEEVECGKRGLGIELLGRKAFKGRADKEKPERK